MRRVLVAVTTVPPAASRSAACVQQYLRFLVFSGGEDNSPISAHDREGITVRRRRAACFNNYIVDIENSIHMLKKIL